MPTREDKERLLTIHKMLFDGLVAYTNNALPYDLQETLIQIRSFILQYPKIAWEKNEKDQS